MERNRAILVADSGTTKTDWIYSVDSFEQTFSTEGVNPVFQTPEKVREILSNVSTQICEAKLKFPKEVWFYSAGVDASDVANKSLGECLDAVFLNSRNSFFTDRFGAARALCGDSAGIACVMGTGSTACFYDGSRIVENVVGGGFILGDEGGGAAIGKKLLSDFIRGILPPAISKALEEEFSLDYNTVVENVYKKPMPNRYLASFSKFVATHKGDSHLSKIVSKCFDEFFERCLSRFDLEKYPVNAVGSTAYFYSEELKNSAARYGGHIGKILRAPAQELLKFHKIHSK